MGEITWCTLAATLAAPFVFLLPGGALLCLLLPPESFDAERRPDAASWLILAAGLGLALAPIGLLVLRLVGLEIGTGSVLASLAVSAAVVVWRRGPGWWAWLRRPASWRERLVWLDAPLVALALVVILIVGVRLWIVRGVNVGFWGDSYQHTMIAQLMLDNGGLFDSWAPYVPLQSFTYHFGFHGDVALFQWATGWLTGNPTPRTAVLVGQFLNALAALALYPLTVRLSRGNRWAGVAAVLSAGLLASTPMSYTNWGRYTQLAGQVILPVAMWLTMEALEAARGSARRVGVAALAVAGLGLTHYRVSVYYAIFMVPYLGYLLLARRPPARQWARPLWRLAAVGLLALLLAGPWIWHLGSGLLPNNLVRYHQGALPDSFRAEYNTFIWSFSPAWLAWLALAGALWAIVRRQRMVLVALWAGLLLVAANPHQVGLPDTGLVNNFAVMIGLYMPLSMLAGYLFGDLLALAARRWPAIQALAVVLIAVVAATGAVAQADTLQPVFQLVTQEDEQAMRWIEENTPPDAKFLANSFFAFGDYVIVGSDAGWWIPLLSSRENTVPPATYSMEASDPPDYRERVNAVARRVEEGDLGDPETVAFLQSQGITHVYVGRIGGPLLDPDLLRRSPYYELVYEQGGVLIFALRPPPSPA